MGGGGSPFEMKRGAHGALKECKEKDLQLTREKRLKQAGGGSAWRH